MTCTENREEKVDRIHEEVALFSGAGHGGWALANPSLVRQAADAGIE